MPVWQNVQAELHNMTRGDKTPEKGPSLTFLAPVRLGGARERSRIRGRSNRSTFFSPPNTYLYVSQTVKYGRLWKEDCYNWLLTPSQPWRLY